MASLDELDAREDGTTPTCDPCVVVHGKVCVNCTFVGQVEAEHTFPGFGGKAEPMRMCYNFLEYVPARLTFGCTMFEADINKDTK